MNINTVKAKMDRDHLIDYLTNNSEYIIA